MASKITITDIDGWKARVQGSTGSVVANSPVVVTCLDLPNMVLARADSQGAFSTELYSPPGCTVSVRHDPAGKFLSKPDILTDPRPLALNDVPGVQVRYDSTPQGATNFLLTGRVLDGTDPFANGATVPFKISGSVNTLQPAAGGSLSVSGTVHVLLPAGSTVPAGTVLIGAGLEPLADAAGHWTGGTQHWGSTFLSPVGAPIERWTTGESPWATGTDVSLTQAGSVYSASFTIDQPNLSNVPAGMYRLWMFVQWQGAKWPTPMPGGLAHLAMYTIGPGRSFGPVLKVGNAAAPTLPFVMFMDDINNGVRGVEDPSQGYVTAQRIADSASYTVLPLLDSSGKPRRYRIEPVFPEIGHTDRGNPHAPYLDFKLPGGTFSATVTGPKGTVTLGPETFKQSRGITPATVSGVFLDNGGGHLSEPYALTTLAPSFQYVFPAAGEYTFHVIGSVQDMSGFTWTLDSTFRVRAAEQMDIDPPVLPGVPFKVGEKLPIALQVDPSLPADVTVVLKFAPNSDASKLVTRTYTGRANRYGYFSAPDAYTFDSAGEYSVEWRADYEGSEGAWAGVMAWSGVVADASPLIVVHGRRGIDSEPQPEFDRFTRTQTGIPLEGTHLNFPYHSGDVMFSRDDDSAQVRASFEDPAGVIRQKLQSYPFPQFGLEGSATMQQRLAMNEAPFVSKTTTGLDPVVDRSNVDVFAYFYGSSVRPGERVRQGATEDNTGTYYWRFEEEYAAQYGMGFQGDNLMDVKFQYVGGVIRTPQKNYYGRYASLWAEVPDGDKTGSRVVAPFSEPLMKVGNKDINLFAVLTAVKPGTVLETGDLLILSGQVGPTVAARVHIELVSPDGSSKSWDVATNEIGAFYVPEAQQALGAPGMYRVKVSVKSGTATGGLFQTESFMLPVVSKGSPPLETNLPGYGQVTGLRLTTSVNAKAGTEVSSLITLPGWALDEKKDKVGSDGWAAFDLDAPELWKTFQLIDLRLPDRDAPGLADEFVWVVTSGQGADLRVNRIVLFGPEVFTQ